LHFLVLLWLVFLNMKRKTWQHFRQHSSSLLYVMFFNGLYYYLCKDKLPWDFKSKFLGTKTLRVLHLFLITPLLILAFLSKFSKTFLRKCIYILKWVLVSSLIERIALKSGAIIFKHGWSLS